jgi:hypothetical protein
MATPFRGPPLPHASADRGSQRSTPTPLRCCCRGRKRPSIAGRDWDCSRHQSMSAPARRTMSASWDCSVAPAERRGDLPREWRASTRAAVCRSTASSMGLSRAFGGIRRPRVGRAGWTMNSTSPVVRTAQPDDLQADLDVHTHDGSRSCRRRMMGTADLRVYVNSPRSTMRLSGGRRDGDSERDLPLPADRRQ